MLKVFVLAYDFRVVTVMGEAKEWQTKHEFFTDVSEFISATRETYEQTKREVFGLQYCTKVRTFQGKLSEININKVLEPFS